jgi:hypothetical protein
LLLQALDGQNLALDISVVDPLQQTYLQRAAAQSGVAAQGKADEKVRKYAAYCAQHRTQFRPIVAELFGGWWAPTGAVFKLIAERYALTHHLAQSVALARIYTRLAVTMARLTAAMILERHSRPPADIDHHQVP